MFLATTEFLPQHHAQRRQTLELITTAEARGQQRLAEMNRTVLGNLDTIIDSLETVPRCRSPRKPLPHSALESAYRQTSSGRLAPGS